MIGEGVQTVAVDVDGAGVEAGQKAGPAGGADGTLAVGVAEGHALSHQAVNVWRGNVPVAQGGDGVIALLIGANPEDVGRR